MPAALHATTRGHQRPGWGLCRLTPAQGARASTRPGVERGRVAQAPSLAWPGPTASGHQAALWAHRGSSARASAVSLLRMLVPAVDSLFFFFFFPGGPGGCVLAVGWEVKPQRAAAAGL